MKIIVCDTYEEMSQKAAKIIAAQLVLKPDSVLGLPTGSTPVGTYKALAEMNKKGDIDFKDIITFNLDEYYPISPENDQSYRYFMNKTFFEHINIDINNTHVLNGLAENPDAECENYERMINEAGGIDLQLLGIGQNGHIGFNEPADCLISRTHLTGLTENTIKANSRFFEKIEDVPTQSLTMGIATILKAKKIVILANGANKHRVVNDLINGEISSSNPASILKVHPDVTLICDKDAYSSSRLGVDIGGTDMKVGVIDDKNEIVYKESFATDSSSCDALVNQIVEKCSSIMSEFNIDSVGIGTPGSIRDGLVTASNLPFKAFDLENALKEKLNIPVVVNNDANCAALGEALFGAGKDAKNLVMITLGTGIGGGIIIDNRIYHGSGDAGEIGHMCFEVDGIECPCGRKGCWEQYASTAALERKAIEAACANKDSILYNIYAQNGNKMDGKLFFAALKAECNIAKAVYDKHLDDIAVGIGSLIKIFAPDMIVLSGGITNEGELLVKPLVDKLNTDIPVRISELKKDAGIVGAAMLQ